MLLLIALACQPSAEPSEITPDRGSTPGAGGDDTGDAGPGGPGDGGYDDGGPGDSGSGGGGAPGDTDTAAPAGETGDTDAGDGSWTGTPGEHALSFDGRDVWLYVPAGYDGGSALPLVVGFHGAGDSGRNFYAVAGAYGWTAAADDAGFALLIPSTKSPYSDFAVWSGNPNDDVDEMIAELGEILEIADTLGETWRLDPARRHAFGFSDGGLFAAVAGMDASDRLGSLSIFGYGWGGFYPLVTPSRAIPVQFLCGDRDSFYSYARASEDYLAGQGHDTRFLGASGVSHSFSGLMGAVSPGDLAGWMLDRPLP